eukprot:GHVS01001630.1.p2 GENE.GHVS01001630.1~~GHVS01001630.1.p2  ORF type:complete len:125 (+),score=18.68 GHVS01001630.1:328-702(+)
MTGLEAPDAVAGDSPPPNTSSSSSASSISSHAAAPTEPFCSGGACEGDREEEKGPKERRMGRNGLCLGHFSKAGRTTLLHSQVEAVKYSSSLGKGCMSLASVGSKPPRHAPRRPKPSCTTPSGC